MRPGGGSDQDDEVGFAHFDKPLKSQQMQPPSDADSRNCQGRSGGAPHLVQNGED